MQEDVYGFVYPVIDADRCTGCGLCARVCHITFNTKLTPARKAYASWNRVEEKRCQSSSGGLASVLSEHILRQKGVVYGTNNIENGRINVIRIENENEVTKLKGSKYVHSYVERTYRMAEEDLEKGRKVLFIGTPCQIAGIRSYIDQRLQRTLFLVDLVCHGVPSQRFLRDELADTISLEDISRISFRDNNKFVLRCYDKNSACVYEKAKEESCYYRAFMEGFIYRDCCYTCKFAGVERGSDITIGDFWGIGQQGTLFRHDIENGVSLVLPTTNKGVELLEQCKDELFLEERDVSEAVSGNTQLRYPTRKTWRYGKFRKAYLDHGFKKACKKALLFKDMEDRIVVFLRSHKVTYLMARKVKRAYNSYVRGS